MKTLKRMDKVNICGIEYVVMKNYWSSFFMSICVGGNNGGIFDLLKIEDKYGFQKKILGYTHYQGMFPNCDTLEDLTKLVEALINYKKEEELPDLSTEFIVDCADNEKSVKEVANWLTVNRGHIYTPHENDSFDKYEAVVCKKYQVQSLHLTINKAIECYPHYKIYTFEQFKKAIDMQNIKEERKIIGYKAPFDMFNRGVKCGDIFMSHGNYTYDNSGYTVPKEIVEKWEPVYEEISKDKVFTLRCTGNDFELKVTPNGIFYEPENAQLNSNTLCAIINPSTLQDGKYRWWQILEYVDLGCKKRVPVEDIKSVLDYYEKIR